MGVFSVEGKTVVVLGMARSGISAAKLLHSLGARVLLADSKGRQALGAAVDSLVGLEGIEWHLGEEQEPLLSGADILLISPGVPIDSAVVRAAKAQGVEVMAEVELAYRLSRGLLVGITGTNGKTTTTTLVGEIFKAAGKKTHVVGNIGFPYTEIAKETTDQSVTVCELSSFQMESVAEFAPSISAILNIAEDHLNRHHTMETYIAMKARIFVSHKASDSLILNYDDQVLRALAGQAPCRIVWFSRRGEVPFGAFVKDGVIMFGSGSDSVPVCPAASVFIPGPHNLENALAAVAIAMTAGVSPQVIAGVLERFRGVEHRCEFVREVRGVRFVNDSKGTNADSVFKAIAAMDRPTVLIAGGSDKHVDFAPLCAAIKANEFIEHVVLIGDTAPQFDRQLTEAGFTDFRHMGYEFEAAVKAAFAWAKEGGNVLLSPACASFDMFKDYEDRGAKFKAIVNSLMEID